MELRVLQYFLAVAREESITGAAEALHLSQPTLSRQLKDLEEELGSTLFVRGARRVTLTEEGMLFRRRAEEIMELVHKAESEVVLSGSTVVGDVYIGAAETDGVRLLARAAHTLQAEHPGVRLHIMSGDGEEVTEQLDGGLIDFGLLLGEVDRTKYETLALPSTDTWGVLLRRDDSLAEKETLTPKDLWDRPLIFNRLTVRWGDTRMLLGKDVDELNIAGTYNLAFNGSLMAAEGVGLCVCLDKIVHTESDPVLCFRPLKPSPAVAMNLVWKKYAVRSKAAEAYLAKIRELFAPGSN
ncbi:MAG: LysR family transcriptional regulator [Acutalibacter sp.]|nr:LysR family transcriptional regulator [Acutalibacter sp.]